MISIVLLALLAQKPANLPAQEAGNYTRVGMPAGKCSCRVMDANTTTYPFVFRTGGTPTPICYGWGTSIVVSTSDQATICLTDTTTVTIGSQTTNLKAYLTDTGAAYSGDGACMTMEGGGKWTIVPSYQVLGNHRLPTDGTSPATIIGGWRGGICSAKQAPAMPVFGNNIDNRVPLCTVSGDCTDAGVSGGTCSTIDTTTEISKAATSGCAFLVGKALNASTEVCACVEM